MKDSDSEELGIKQGKPYNRSWCFLKRASGLQLKEDHRDDLRDFLSCKDGAESQDVQGDSSFGENQKTAATRR